MDKKAIERLKKELLTKKSHDIFKNVGSLFDIYKLYPTASIVITNYKQQKSNSIGSILLLYKN